MMQNITFERTALCIQVDRGSKIIQDIVYVIWGFGNFYFWKMTSSTGVTGIMNLNLNFYL